MLLRSPICRRLFVVALLMLGLFASSHAQAATCAVTNLDDSGAGSLRQAITDAEEAPGDDAIVFAAGVKGTLVLARALPDIRSTIRITGPSAKEETLTIQGNDGQDIRGNLTLSNLTFAKCTSAEGGVFSNTGQLTINNCYFTGNQATSFNGGAIYNGGTVVINDSTFSGNRAPSSFMDMGGGALFNYRKMTVNRCTFSGNSALKGGAIYNLGTASLIITSCTFAGNEATQGGVIYNDLGDIAIEACTFANNRALESGGAIFHSNATLDISNCTFSSNRAAQKGGAIYNEVNWVTIDSSTFARNQAGQEGGALYNSDKLDLSNSIVAGNSAPNGPNIHGTMSQGDYNLVDNATGAKLIGKHNITGQVARLGTLTNNGGPTQTLALLIGSPAIGKGSTSLPTDQRGVRRLTNRPTDIGAFSMARSPRIRGGVGSPNRRIGKPSP